MLEANSSEDRPQSPGRQRLSDWVRLPGAELTANDRHLRDASETSYPAMRVSTRDLCPA